MNKKILIFLILFLSVIPLKNHNVNALYDNIEIKHVFKVNSKIVKTIENNVEKKTETTYPVIIVNNRSMVEAYFFIHLESKKISMGATYVSETKDIIYTFEDEESNVLEIDVFTVKNQCKAYYNGNEVTIDTVPFQPRGKEIMIAVSSLVLPIRFIYETFGYTVEWISDTQEIIVYK